MVAHPPSWCRAGGALRPFGALAPLTDELPSWVGVVAAAPRPSFVWWSLLARCRLHVCTGSLVSSGLRPVPVWRGCRSGCRAPLAPAPPLRDLRGLVGGSLRSPPPFGRATAQRSCARAPCAPYGCARRPSHLSCPPFGRAFVSRPFVAPCGRCVGALPDVRGVTLDAPALRSGLHPRWLGSLRSHTLSPVAKCGSVRSCVYGALRGLMLRSLLPPTGSPAHCVRGLMSSLRSDKNA